MKYQRGVSFLEVLIALLVLSIGLVGVAAMQLKALQSATAGYQHSVATLAAVDAQERLWAELLHSSGNDCSDIDVENATTLQDDPDNSDNPGWQEYWFGVDSQTPIRHFEGAIHDTNSGEYDLMDCEFLVEINLAQSPGDAASENFIYIFRLPNLSD